MTARRRRDGAGAGARMTYPRTPADLIRAIRSAANLTQAALGDLIGVATRTIQDWEAGRYEPRARDLERIAAALRVEVTATPAGGWSLTACSDRGRRRRAS